MKKEIKKQKNTKDKDHESPFVELRKVPGYRINAGVYAKELLISRVGNIDSALQLAESLARPLIGTDQSIKNPNYPFWNTVRNTLKNIKLNKEKQS